MTDKVKGGSRVTDVLCLSCSQRAIPTVPPPLSQAFVFSLPHDPMTQPRNPLHGITLEQMLTELIDSLGWEAMGLAVPIRCFTHDPSIASSLKFLRRTPWARQKTEELYLHQRK